MKQIFLASKSPRRKEILKRAGLNFSIVKSDYEESLEDRHFSYKKIENLAKNKALGAVVNADRSGLIIGADTVVILDNIILTKPKDKEDAFSMLKQLSGNIHQVVTSVCVYDIETKEFVIESTTTNVEFEKLTDAMINSYIDDFKPFDKAGAYGIQELPKGFVKEVNGDIENVIGISSKSVLKGIKRIKSLKNNIY